MKQLRWNSGWLERHCSNDSNFSQDYVNADQINAYHMHSIQHKAQILYQSKFIQCACMYFRSCFNRTHIKRHHLRLTPVAKYRGRGTGLGKTEEKSISSSTSQHCFPSRDDVTTRAHYVHQTIITRGRDEAGRPKPRGKGQESVYRDEQRNRNILCRRPSTTPRFNRFRSRSRAYQISKLRQDESAYSSVPVA